MDGITATQEVRRLFPRTAVLVLTVFDPPAIVFDALSAGALGYWLKGAAPSVRVSAIEKIAIDGRDDDVVDEGDVHAPCPP